MSEELYCIEDGPYFQRHLLLNLALMRPSFPWDVTFPNDFSMLQLSMGMFPSGNFLNMQFPKRQLLKSVLATALGPKPVLAAALGPLAHTYRNACSLLHL